MKQMRHAAVTLQSLSRRRSVVTSMRISEAAATKIQSLVRRREVRQKIREEAECATIVQSTFRSALKRKQLAAARLYAAQVVQTKWGAQALRERSESIKTVGKWEQLKDSKTGKLWYFHVDDVVAKWSPPPDFVATFVCNFDDCVGGVKDICRARFQSHAELEAHRQTAWGRA